jgi:hypothetical protein
MQPGQPSGQRYPNERVWGMPSTAQQSSIQPLGDVSSSHHILIKSVTRLKSPADILTGPEYYPDRDKD